MTRPSRRSHSPTVKAKMVPDRSSLREVAIGTRGAVRRSPELDFDLERTQLQLNLGDSRFRRRVIPFVSAGQEAGRHDTSPVDGSA